MYLSRLELHGFKSFAQKTTVAFSPGVTAIVGPNGCGKSNVIDAVRWVLGEQRARTLRSDSMAGVIFNGAADKRPLGLAEVSLTVENTRGVLPTEYSEVTVTRRLYRNGDSEYVLNGTVCRLRDVQDLFMDTGLGAGAYSVIELKMVEDILSEQADDRRRLFEEAAGVTKYKKRRAQALRRLDTTQADLTRLDDIVEEVDKQVRSLERQAKKAARHERLATRLRRLELAMAAHDVARLQTERSALEATVREQADQAEALGARLAAGEAGLEGDRTELVRLEQAMAGAARALQAHAEGVRSLEAEIRLGAERQSAGRRALERIEKERGADAARAEDAQKEQAEAGVRIEQAEAEVAERAATLGSAEAARVEAHDAAGGRRQASQSARSAAAEAAGALRDAQAAVERARDRRALLEAEVARVAREQAEVEAAPETTDSAPSLVTAEAALEAAAARLADAVAARDDARAAFERVDADRQQAEGAARAARAQAALLQTLVEAGAQGDDAVAFLAADPDVQATTVAELVGADEPDRLALDAALGAWTHAVVVASEADADAAIRQLRAADRGRATFLVLDRLPDAAAEPTPPGTTPMRDLARAPDAYAPLLDALLARTFVAESLDAARSLRDAFPAARFVTRDGAWTDAGGAVHGGSPTPSAGASRLGVRERQEQAAADLADAEHALADAQARAHAARQASDDAETARRKAEAALESHRADRDRARDAAARQQAQAAARADRLARLAARADETAQALGALPATDELEAEAEARAQSARDAQARQTDADAAYEEAAGARSAAETAWSDARLAHARAQADLQSARDAQARAARTLGEVGRRQSDRDAEQARIEAELSQAQGAASDVTSRLDDERHRTDALQTAASDAETAVLQGRARIADAEGALRQLRSKREAAADARGEAERRLVEVATRQETTLERLAEEHSADLDQAAAELDALRQEGEADGESFQPEAARAEIPDLRRKLRDLGAVNALALESYDQEQTRLAFLQEQRDDLAGAEATLLETIQEINETARRRFDETFGQIRQAFQRLFSDLFGGDAQADVALDGDDPLEAPVTITARPRGKRPVSLAQLSGGEKTLTATALLFSIYLVKPSPFCILDEVDAPLDDANVGRFMSLIRSFADSTQFILVTHNKLTMEAADRMYGVTMPTPGISRLVGVQFEEGPVGAETAPA